MATAAVVALTGANAIPGRHTFKKTFALQYPNGDAVDLTPYSANGLEAEFRLDANNASKVFDLAGAGDEAGSDGIDISGDATLGLIEITISDATTHQTARRPVGIPASLRVFAMGLIRFLRLRRYSLNRGSSRQVLRKVILFAARSPVLVGTAITVRQLGEVAVRRRRFGHPFERV